MVLKPRPLALVDATWTALTLGALDMLKLSVNAELMVELHGANIRGAHLRLAGEVSALNTVNGVNARKKTAKTS
ncbi:hypothetical protein PR003_g6460 [Phytophthora rubi]|uniref:Uncharacterized protein n=1 Tax=Phytophthora rubi TaxID=129364 RepID=A0A6A3NQ49_9STRA|nr:hypothetical protein PR002_g9602 [Phytophthora rubi]KAE9042574.1 hypothetical protein PR001_g6142 [Phytophthora rubi]KAE9348363.1 hypothetical protein PR003_g6460 [Phytophthora rubi]